MKKVKTIEFEFEDYDDIDSKEVLTGVMISKYSKLQFIGEKLAKDFKFNEENNTELLKEVAKEFFEVICVIEKLNKII